VNPPALWFCCLADPERTVWRLVALDLPVTLFVGVPLPIFETMCAAAGLSPDWRVDAFLLIYHLVHARVVSGEEEIEVITAEDGFLSLWVDNGLFALTPAAACLGGCPLSKAPTP